MTEAAGRGFGWLQVFIPPIGGGMALEPVSCDIKAFNTGEGLTVLEPGQAWSTRCGLRPT